MDSAHCWSRRSCCTATHTVCPSSLLWLRRHVDKWLSRWFDPPGRLHLTLVCFKKQKSTNILSADALTQTFDMVFCQRLKLSSSCKILIEFCQRTRLLFLSALTMWLCALLVWAVTWGCNQARERDWTLERIWLVQLPLFVSPLLFLPLLSFDNPHLHHFASIHGSRPSGGAIKLTSHQLWGDRSGENVQWSTAAEVLLWIALYM